MLYNTSNIFYQISFFEYSETVTFARKKAILYLINL